MVTVRFFTSLRQITQTSERFIDREGNVHDILEALIDWKKDLQGAIYDEKGNLYVIIFLNGRDIDYLNGLETMVISEDIISLFPPIAGG